MKDSSGLLLAIDNGTQSLKALVFDLQGNLAAKKQVYFEPFFSKHPGWAEQDVAVFWDALCAGCQGLWHERGIDPRRIAGVAVTTQRNTLVNLDAEGNPLRPALSWLDQRRTPNLPFLSGPWGILFRVLGLKSTIAYLQSEAKINWIRTHQPDIWAKTEKLMFLSGYLTYRLTGAFVDSIGCQVGYVPFDYKRMAWARRWDWKWKAIPMDPGLLPDLVRPTEILGEITEEASRATGIPQGLPLVAAAADKACEVVGSGSLEPSVGCLSYGTTATINVTHDTYVEPVPLLPAYPAAVPDRHTLEVQIFRGYWMVSWFKQEFGHAECVEAEERGIQAEALFDRLIDDVPPGAMGLMLQPFWTPGLKNPGPEAKGAIIGFGDVHTKGHVYRAILEGVAFALREGRERIEKKTGIPITLLKVSGGGSQSRHAMQVTADVFGLPTARPHLYETSGLGAAIDIAVGLKLFSDFPAAVDAMCHVGAIFEPNRQTHRLYDRLYRNVYRSMYRRLKPLYREIRRITGYPK